MGLTKSERHNRMMDKIFDEYHRQLKLQQECLHQHSHPVSDYSVCNDCGAKLTVGDV